jgi:hypothetical protein
MATKVKRSGGKSDTKKGSTKAKASSNGSSGESEASRKRGELAAKLEKEAPQIAKRLQGDGKMKDEKARYGLSSDVAIVKALARKGFNSKGGELDVPEIGNVDKAAGKKALVKARTEGTPWYVLELATGKSESELKTIVEEAGGPTGRVYRNSGEKADKAGR